MDALQALLSETLERNLAFAGPLLGLLTFGESLAVIGAVIPATAVMLVAGGLCATGQIELLPVVAWCLTGAIAGDAISFWMGRSLGPVALRHPVLRGQRRSVARTRLFFRKHGLWTVAFYRFTGPVRAFVPLLAGATLMPQRRFQTLNIVSALLWTPLMLLPGYIAAEGVSIGAQMWNLAR